jgi:peptidase E
MSKEKELLGNDKIKAGEKVEEVGTPVKSMIDEMDVHDEEHGHEHISDLSQLSKEDLLKMLESMKLDENLSKASAMLKQIKYHYDHLLEVEKNDALSKFLANGGEETDFDYRRDNVSLKFDKQYDQLRNKLSEHFLNLEKDKEKNLTKKNELLDKLRALISAEETQTSITSLKEIQEEWRKIGPVPAAHTQEIWANYNALVERFYNNRSIYFELKELDRKKNLEAKIEICEKAEGLAESGQTVNALIRELKALHEEFRNIGPVPKEDQEVLWNRFKIASDKIYEKRGEYYKELRERQEQNLEVKIKLAEAIAGFAQFQTSRIEEWKQKTAELLELQEKWKQAGGVPQDKGKEISKKFWSACKSFFHNKEVFFKHLEVEKEENLKKKIALCERAEVLKDQTDSSGTATELKNLQKEWEAIGPVPIKEKEPIFRRFKAACDHFFNKKRELQAEHEKEFKDNLEKKNALIQRLENLNSEKDSNPDDLKIIQDEWKKIGFVPKTEMKDINARYQRAVDNFLGHLEGDKSEVDKLKLSLQINALKTNPEGGKKLYQKEKEIHRKISVLKQEIDRLNTNLEFFAKSAAADKLKKEFYSKIEVAKNEIDELKEQLKMIKDAENEK